MLPETGARSLLPGVFQKAASASSDHLGLTIGKRGVLKSSARLPKAVHVLQKQCTSREGVRVNVPSSKAARVSGRRAYERAALQKMMRVS